MVFKRLTDEVMQTAVSGLNWRVPTKSQPRPKGTALPDPKVERISRRESGNRKSEAESAEVGCTSILEAGQGGCLSTNGGRPVDHPPGRRLCLNPSSLTVAVLHHHQPLIHTRSSALPRVCQSCFNYLRRLRRKSFPAPSSM